MKPGEIVTISFREYLVCTAGGGIFGLKRLPRWMTLSKFNKFLRARRWRRPSVSANFIVDVKTGRTFGNYQMLAIGLSSKRIERLHNTLPLIEAQ